MSALEDEPLTEAERVRLWRRGLLLDLGVDWSLADLYAEDVDPHDVEALVKNHCVPPDLAIHLLRP